MHLNAGARAGPSWLWLPPTMRHSAWSTMRTRSRGWCSLTLVCQGALVSMMLCVYGGWMTGNEKGHHTLLQMSCATSLCFLWLPPLCRRLCGALPYSSGSQVRGQLWRGGGALLTSFHAQARGNMHACVRVCARVRMYGWVWCWWWWWWGGGGGSIALEQDRRQNVRLLQKSLFKTNTTSPTTITLQRTAALSGPNAAQDCGRGRLAGLRGCLGLACRDCTSHPASTPHSCINFA